jgi:hypothetical protein
VVLGRAVLLRAQFRRQCARRRTLAHDTSVAIPVPPGKSLPDLPAGGIDLAAPQVAIPGARVIDHDLISPGPDPSTYVFTRTDLQRNLFRIPLH